MSKTLQQEIANGITQKFKDAVVKKIDKDNYLDIHLPSVNPKKGTHLGINTAKGEIKIVFYCREDDFNSLVLNKSKKIEEYAQGLRIKNNPAFNDASKAIEAAIDFVMELMKVNGNSSKSETTEAKTKIAVPKKAVPKTENKPIIKKSDKTDSQLAIEAYENEDFESVIDYFEKGGKSFLIKKGRSSNYVYLEKQLDKNDTPRLVKLMEVSQSETKNPPDGIVFTKMKISKSDKLSSGKRPEESDFEAMIRAFKEGDMDKVNDYIERGNPILQFNQDESLIENELITVCVADPVDLDLLKKIIKRGDDLNAQNNDSDKYTAVHYCAWDGKADALSILLKNGALPDIVGGDGRTALHLAAANGFTDVVKLLVKAGVDIDRRIPNDDNKQYSKNGSTALREAVYNQFWDVIDLLIKNGADFKNLTEPCSGSIQGKKDLFDVIRLLENEGQYSEGNFDEEKLDELENMVKGIEEEEIVNEDEQQEDDTLDLDDFDINEDSAIKFICDKIKREKYLTNLLYVNESLDAKGFSVDKHQAYFFDSSVLISDNEMEGFLVVNMDGFYSNCVNEDEMQMIFSWSGVNDLEYQEDGDGCSIDIIADQGRLTIKKEGSHSLKILYTFYKHVWKAINDKFKDEPFIAWNDVWDMGIKEVGFAEFIDYYTFDVTSNEADVQEEEIEEEVEEEQEQEEIDETDTGADEEEDVADDFSFAEGKTYKKHFNRFLEIANKTGIHINDINVEPNNIERDELWDISREFAQRIYQLDNDKNADQNEINFLCYYAVVSLHWCDIFNQNDKRYSHENGRFRRDTVALALCFFARIDREFKYYDFLKETMVVPHMQFSVLMWTINTIINNDQDTLFGIFSPKQAEQANDLFKQLTRKNGGADPINPNDAPENHPLRAIWWEVYRQFNNVRIPYQFIKSYISQMPPKRTFIQNLFKSKPEVRPGMNVTLLEEDRIKNIAFLEKQILHKQFPNDWVFINDLAFVSIYFATTTDGQLSAVEKNTIYNLLGEWITEEDENKKQQKVADTFTKAKAEFDKDKSHERFEFALENIRRNFYVKFEYDDEKTHNQLKFVFNDLVAIANSDDDEIASEVELLKSIMEEWEIEMSEVADDDGEEEDTDDDSEEDEEEKKLNQLLSKYGVNSESELTSITVEQAKELASYKGTLDLSGLTTLSENVAKSLAQHNGNLILDGLTSLSDKAINSIATHKGGYLSLEGFVTLNDAAAQALSKHEGLLFLKGVTTLSENASKSLAQHKGDLLLDGLTHLSDGAIEQLASHKVGYLSLDGLTLLSEKAIEALAKHPGALYLNGLTNLSDKAALALSKHTQELCLNGLTELSDKAAIALSNHEGELSLNGLTYLSDKAAEALAEKGIKIDEEDDSEDEGENNNDGEFDEFYKRYFDEFYTDNLWNRHKDEVEFEIKPFPGTLNSSSFDHINGSDYELLFRKFTKSEVEFIVNKIKKTKTYFRLPFVKECLSGKMNLNEKEPFWFIPLVGYGYGVGSLLYFNQDGIHNIDSDSESFDNFIHVDLWKNLDVKSGYNGLMEEYDFEDYKEDDNTISSLKIDFFNPSTGNSGSVNIVEFHGENYGSTLRIVKALWDYAWKAIVEANKGRSVFVLNLPNMPLPVSFNSWEELIEWAKN